MASGRSLFEFITDEQFRSTLETDFREMQTCAANEAWKAVYVLAGSLLEAVLLDYFLAIGATKPDPRKMTLDQLIDAGQALGVLSERTSQLSSALKSYRNLIHPGRAMRLGETADRDGAIVAQSLVSIVVKEIAANQQSQYGPTAEQIATKFASDPSALAISQHLLKDAKPQELERLLLHVLPTRYLDEYSAEYVDDARMDTYARLFREVFDLAEVSVKKKVASAFVTVLKEEPGALVRVYEEEFFRAPDLAHFDDDGRSLVKAHLLARLREEATPKVLAVMRGVGEFLTEEDVLSFVDPLVRTAVQASHPLARSARTLLEEEATRTPAEIDPSIIARLEAWERFFQQRSETAAAEIVSEISKAFQWEDIPF
jgi:hypothetical protein